MTEKLPQVFIGSSAEGLDVAREVELQLEHTALTTIWKDGVFGLGSGTLESLMDALDGFDFAVMVLSPDDLLESRKSSYASPRDNVIFELGLFMGRLGRKRTFIVHEKGANLKLPSDLDGITASPYRKRENLSAALSPTCTPIIKAIKALGHFEGHATTQVDASSTEAGSTPSLGESSQIPCDIANLLISSGDLIFPQATTIPFDPPVVGIEFRDKRHAEIALAIKNQSTSSTVEIAQILLLTESNSCVEPGQLGSRRVRQPTLSSIMSGTAGSSSEEIEILVPKPFVSTRLPSDSAEDELTVCYQIPTTLKPLPPGGIDMIQLVLILRDDRGGSSSTPRPFHSSSSFRLRLQSSSSIKEFCFKVNAWGSR